MIRRCYVVCTKLEEKTLYRVSGGTGWATWSPAYVFNSLGRARQVAREFMRERGQLAWAERA